jgi:hypothetical protein
LTRKLAATVAPRKNKQEATVEPASHAALFDFSYRSKQMSNHTTTLIPRMIFTLIGFISNLP